MSDPGKSVQSVAEAVSGVTGELFDAEAFQHGMELGKEWAGTAARTLATWAEENPAQFILAGAITGFVLGKVLFRAPARRRYSLPDFD